MSLYISAGKRERGLTEKMANCSTINQQIKDIQTLDNSQFCQSIISNNEMMQ